MVPEVRRQRDCANIVNRVNLANPVNLANRQSRLLTCSNT